MSKKSETQNQLVAFKEQLAKDLAEVGDRLAPPSGNRITTKGKVFTLPNGKQDPGPMQCVILDWRSTSLYYDGAYDANNPRPPQCFAIGKIIKELTPSENSPKKVHSTCEGCPMNQWGSAPVGKGKACKNGRRLAIAAVDADAETQPMIIEVSPTGIGSFEAHVNRLATQLGVLPIQVVTTISFVESSTFPQLVFSTEGALDEAKIPLMMSLKETAQALVEQEPRIK
jgi:hypothetical protein